MLEHGTGTDNAADETPGHRLLNRRTLVLGAGSAALAASVSGGVVAQDSATPVAENATPTTDDEIWVYPMPGSVTASAGTQISFRGAALQSLDLIEVIGSQSGYHSGTQIAHSDGNGFSFVPDFGFRPAEAVAVRTRVHITNADAKRFSFTIAESRPLPARPELNETADEALVHKYRSRPGLAPPVIETFAHATGTAPGYLFLAPKRGTGRNGALMVDDSGEPVWFNPVAVPAEEIYDFRVSEFLGRPALVWWQGITVSGHGFGHWVICNDQYEEVATVRVGNGFSGGDMHDFVLTPENTAIIGTYNTLHWDLSDVGGEKDGYAIDGIIQEIDIVTGAVMFEWHSLEHIALDESYGKYDPKDPGDFDYFHLNSVAVDSDGHLIVNARNTWAAYKVNRRSGKVTWRYGGKQPDFTMGEGTEVAYHHDARPHDNGRFSFCDNGGSPKVHDESRGLIVALDMDKMTATLVREYAHPDKISSSSQGNAQVLGNGNVLVGWGSEPVASEFAEDGTLLHDWRLPKEKQSYRAFRFEWSGKPSAGPSLVVDSESSNSMAYVSWNGATEVRAWRLKTGTTSDSLEPDIDTIEKTGFETEIPVDTSSGFLAVEALDASGAVIGTTKTVELNG